MRTISHENCQFFERALVYPTTGMG